jgi:cell division protein FtsI/penicillin-binding protein 2
MKSSRIFFIGFFVIACALLFVGRLYYLQIMYGDHFRNKADRQYTKQGDTIFNRGSIFFSAKDGSLVSAATLKTGYTLALNPKLIEYPEDVYNSFSDIFELSEEDFLLKATKVNDSYEEIAKRLDTDTKTRIESLKLAGVNVYKEKWRYYPYGKIAAHTLGFVGYKEENEIGGLYGLEKYYNDTLSRSSEGAYQNFFAEIFLNLSESLKGKKSEGDIVLTIEPTVQEELENRLQKIEDTWKSDLSGGVIMDPYTGEIYALALAPTFDLNAYSSEKDFRVFGNPIIQGVYEMGSIVKPLAMAAGIDAGVVTPETTFTDKGSVTIDGAKISNFDGRGRGEVNMQKVLNDSLNTGMAFVASRLGNKQLTDYYVSLGLGEETGIDLPGEVYGKIENLFNNRAVEHATAAFGQGIALTPIATVRALSALGNGGILPNPHVVKRIDYTTGLSKEVTASEPTRVFSEKTSETITRMLVNVVDEALLKGTVKIPRYSVAAKTGTAQIARTTERGYYDDRFLHSFFGYFPAYKPRFIIFLFTVYPKGAEYASHTLTEPFMDMTKFLISYYSIPPDR